MCWRTLLVQKWYKSWYKKTGGVMANNLLYTPFGYYLRVMVPKDLREALGKREIKKSLTTLNLSCAIKAAQLLMPEIKHLFSSLRGRTMSRSKRAILSGLTEITIRDRLDEFGRPYQEREMTVDFRFI
jgi:hypothetical protein